MKTQPLCRQCNSLARLCRTQSRLNRLIVKAVQDVQDFSNSPMRARART